MRDDRDRRFDCVFANGRVHPAAAGDVEYKFSPRPPLGCNTLFYLMFWKRFATRIVRWLFPWMVIEPPVMSLTEFNQDELWRWCMPEEFSFGQSGVEDTLQPVPPRFRDREPGSDVAVRTHRLRVQIAVLRKQLGCPPIYWKQGFANDAR